MHRTLIVIPVVDALVGRTCLNSLHSTVLPQTLVVDNCRAPLRWHRSATFRAGHNLGVARSWNVGILHAQAHGFDAVAFVSSAAVFGPAGARDLAALDPGEWGVTPAPAYWHTVVFPLRLFERIGLPDENLYPAYGEDSDLLRRMLLCGINLPDVEVPLDVAHHRDGHGVDRLRETFPGRATINYDALQDYFLRKWGVTWLEPHRLDKGHRHPFGNPANDVSFWPAATVDELRARYGIVGW